MAFGEYDLVVIAEMSGAEAMARVVRVASALGRASGGKTTEFLTMDKAVTAMTST